MLHDISVSLIYHYQIRYVIGGCDAVPPRYIRPHWSHITLSREYIGYKPDQVEFKSDTLISVEVLRVDCSCDVRHLELNVQLLYNLKTRRSQCEFIDKLED